MRICGGASAVPLGLRTKAMDTPNHHPTRTRAHHRKDPPETERPTGPPKDDDYDERYDSFEILPLNPVKALTEPF